MALQFIWALVIVASLFCVASTQTVQPCAATSTPTGTCSASVSVEPTQPGHAAIMYNNINVHNTGSCGVSKVFVDITLPPYAAIFAYYNVSNQTGELFGVTNMITPGSTLLGGVIALQSARIPLVSMGSVECDPACSGTPQATRRTRTPITRPESEPVKLEVQWGANPSWIAIHLIGDAGATRDVRLSHAGSVSQHLMKRENWGNKVVFTFSGEKMELPLSLELASVENDKITLKDAITTFSHVVLDTGLSYTDSQAINMTESDVKLQVHPDSNSHWIAIKPQTTRNVAQMSVKAQNTQWVLMQRHTSGFFEFTSRHMAIQLPISVKLAFDDSSSLEIENAVPKSRS